MAEQYILLIMFGVAAVAFTAGYAMGHIKGSNEERMKAHYRNIR